MFGLFETEEVQPKGFLPDFGFVERGRGKAAGGRQRVHVDQPVTSIKNSFDALKDDVETEALIAAMADLNERSKEFENIFESISTDAAQKVPEDLDMDEWFDDEDILELADARPPLPPWPHWTEVLAEIQEKDRLIESKMIRCDAVANFAEHPIGSSGVSLTTADEEGREIGDNHKITTTRLLSQFPIRNPLAEEGGGQNARSRGRLKKMSVPPRRFRRISMSSSSGQWESRDRSQR